MTKDSSTSAAQLAWAASFIERGLSVLILHDVCAGRCSCLPRKDGKDCPPGSQGKHPRMGGAWQHAGLDNLDDVTQWLTAYPGANLGILTGPASGVWVLDVDPKNGGDTALAKLEREYGPLPATYEVRTGSGGKHLYWLLPDDFTPSSSPGRLPAGLDVRGAGGQVVAPGSRTLIGDYAVSVDVAPAAAPGWLLDHIRPRVVTESRGQGPDWGGASGVVADAEDPRLRRYALAAVERELQRLREATPGRRGKTAFTVACNLIELGNSPWAGLNMAVLRAAYDTAAEIAMLSGGAFDAAEADTSWHSAARTVRAGQRAVPAELDAGGVVPGVDWTAGAGVPPFAGPAAAGEPGLLANPFAIPVQRSDPGQGPADVSRNLAESRGQTLDADASAFEAEVRLQMRRMAATEEARRRIRDDAGERQAIKDRLRKHLLRADELDALDGLAPLVAGWLVKDSVVRINGESGAGKSFVLLDLAAAVATGRPWHGHQVAQGNVVYLVAEGAAGMGKRVRAWERHHGAELDAVHFLTVPVQAGSAEWDAFVELVTELCPVLVILDTQARITVGMEENSATEMGLLVHAVEQMRAATRACVALVHHKGVAGADRGRGSTAVKAAVQTELFVTRNRNVVCLSQGKQKDDAESADLEFVMTPVPLGTDRQGMPVGSIVLRQTTAIVGSGRPEPIDLLLAVMHESFAIGNGGTKAEIQHVVVADRGLMKRTAFYVAWNELLRRKCIGKVPGTAGGWRYVEIDDRASMVEPLNDTKNPDAFFVPRGN